VVLAKETKVGTKRKEGLECTLCTCGEDKKIRMNRIESPSQRVREYSK
jgi:hypothetical protein